MVRTKSKILVLTVQTAFETFLVQFTVALFVFQAAAARARIVAVNNQNRFVQALQAEVCTVRVERFGNQIGFCDWPSSSSISGASSGRFEHRADALCGRGVVVFAIALDLNGSQQSGNVLFDTAPLVFKHSESFAFVFLFRFSEHSCADGYLGASSP